MVFSRLFWKLFMLSLHHQFFFVFQLKMPMLDTKYLMKNPCILNSGEETSQFMNDRTEGRYAIKTLKVRILRFISANGQGEHGCIQLMTCSPIIIPTKGVISLSYLYPTKCGGNTPKCSML